MDALICEQSSKTYTEIKTHTGVLNKLQIEIKAFGLLSGAWKCSEHGFKL